MTAVAALLAFGQLAAADWRETELAVPPEGSRIDNNKESYAQGSFQVILSRGGPTGAYLWCHLHGRHEGREGSSKYTVTPMVKDEDGYTYDFDDLKPQTLTIGSNPTKPAVDKHLYGQFKLTGEALEAFKNGRTLKVFASGDRKRAGINDELAGAFTEFLAGKLQKGDLLKKLNAGKKRPF